MNSTLEIVAPSDAPPIETLERADLPAIWGGFASKGNAPFVALAWLL